MQKIIYNKGTAHSQVWVIQKAPFSQDADKGYIYSASYGYIFDKMMKSAGFDDYYVTCLRPDLDDSNSCRILENDLNHYKPPIILVVEEAGKYFCKELEKKYVKNSKISQEKLSAIDKYVGSLLSSHLLTYPHYMVPIYGPETIAKDWALRDIATSIDLGKAKSELDFFKRMEKLEPLPTRRMEYDFDAANERNRFNELCNCIAGWISASVPIISCDIETVYPKTYKSKPSIFLHKHPGYPVTVGLADSSNFGISFNLFRESSSETLILWRLLDKLFKSCRMLGQNFHNFDQYYFEMLGFEFAFTPIDTMIRHSVLWPELPHKLQFLTRQYTREIYYKDEGHGWSAKDQDRLKRYNCLDVCVTYEVWKQQELEFNERPHLR